MTSTTNPIEKLQDDLNWEIKIKCTKFKKKKANQIQKLEQNSVTLEKLIERISLKHLNVGLV